MLLVWETVFSWLGRVYARDEYVCYYHKMTKRLSLWTRPLRPSSHGTEETEPKDPPTSSVSARFYAKHPHLIETPPATDPKPEEPEPEPEPEPTHLEAGSWEGSEPAPESVPTEELPDRRHGKKPRRIARHKTRRHAVSIAVSEEEERILRTYAAGLNKSFSEWSRTLLFRAMGRKVPSRRSKE